MMLRWRVQQQEQTLVQVVGYQLVGFDSHWCRLTAQGEHLEEDLEEVQGEAEEEVLHVYVYWTVFERAKVLVEVEDRWNPHVSSFVALRQSLTSYSPCEVVENCC